MQPSPPSSNVMFSTDPPMAKKMMIATTPMTKTQLSHRMIAIIRETTCVPVMSLYT